MAWKKLKKSRVAVVAGSTVAFAISVFAFMAFEYARFFQFKIAGILCLIISVALFGTALHGWLRERIDGPRRTVVAAVLISALFAPYMLMTDRQPQKCSARIFSRTLARALFRELAILEDVCRVHSMTLSCDGSRECYHSALTSVTSDPDFTNEGKSVMRSLYENRAPGNSEKEATAR